MPILHDWYLKYKESPTDGYIQAWGVVEGHKHQPDGTFIHTSVVGTARLKDTTLIITTANTVYEMPCRDMDRGFLECTRDAIKRLGLSPAEWELITTESIQAFIEREQAQRDYRAKLKYGEIYMLLSSEKPNAVDEVYFGAKEENGDLYAATCQFSVHIGTFTDSVLYYCHHADYTYDVLRFYPHTPTRIEFYHTWDGKQQGVWGYLRNIGKHPVTVELPWGKEIVVNPDAEIQVSFGDGAGATGDWLVLSDLYGTKE